MTVCSQRSEDPGFFIPCHQLGRTCVCGDQVRDEIKAGGLQPPVLEEPPAPAAVVVEVPPVRPAFDVTRLLFGWWAPG